MTLLSKSLRRLGRKASGYRQGKRRKQALALLGSCELFDRVWYVQSYPDVRDSGIDPLRHYFDSGWREGRDPGPDFSTSAYLKTNSDVAALGINPLLHYIEHGKFEGRGAPHEGAPFRATFSPSERFGPAAPCAQFKRQVEPPPRWARAGRIQTRKQDAVTIDGLTVATFPDRDERESFGGALQQLAWFSGQTSNSPELLHGSTGLTLRLHDAWRAGGRILRTRWRNGEESVVVRAIQHLEAAAVIIGEGCVADGLDCIDLSPRNPFFPILFLFTTPAGEFLGCWQLTFPALCRGYLYYSELIALSNGDSPLNLHSLDRQLSERLFALRTGREERMIAKLSVGLARSDGTHPLFQPDYQRWLSSVMHMPVVAGSGLASGAEEYLAAAVQSDGPEGADAGATLKLAGDMVPSLSALVGSSQGGGNHDLAGSFIVESRDRNLASLVRIPRGMAAADFGPDVSSLPTLSSQGSVAGGLAEAPLLAIRLGRRRPLDEAELLMPNASMPQPEAPAISWIIPADQWNEPQLFQSLEALARQHTNFAKLVFLGDVSKTIADQARRLFDDRVVLAAGASDLGDPMETPFAGYLGPGIVLHDRRTALLATQALDASDALTATALIVTAEKRGKGSLVLTEAEKMSTGAALLPGAIVPIAAPQAEFWITRVETLQEGADRKGRHVCVTGTTISRLTKGKSVPPFSFLSAPGERFVKTEALVG